MKGCGIRMMVETYLRRGRRTLERWSLDPKVRTAGMVAGYGGSGFLLSAAGLAGFPQPFVLGLICAGTGWRTLVMCLGAVLGYPAFWGAAGNQGIVWSAAGCMLALLLGKREETRDQPLMIPAIAAFLTGVTGLVFRLLLKDDTPVSIYAMRIALTFGTGVLFTQAAYCRDAVTDWLIGAVAVLALARIGPGGIAGYLAASAIGVSGSFPAAALAGLGLDLAQVTRLPMTAVMCAGFLIRMLPFAQKWKHYAAPGFACLGVMAVCGIWEKPPLVGMFLGGALGALVPVQPAAIRRRGETGVAQVRLELGAEVMSATRQLLLEAEPPPIDQEAILQKALDRSCGTCSLRRNCAARESLTADLLKAPLEAQCRKPGRLIPELHRAQEQLRYLQAERQRRMEYRMALQQQYTFLGDYLRQLADQLPRRTGGSEICFRVETAARSRGKERANGDRCLAFQGSGCKFYLLLCDGMGTGLGAAGEGNTAANMLRRMLMAGFPASHALKSLNSLLILRGRPAAATVDLAEIRLDTGIATVYKWGAAPSWVLTRGRKEKIGTASPPPGIAMDRTHETVEKLSLRRGETLILLSDGLDGEDVLDRLSVTPDAPPGELAAEILEKGCQQTQDDSTAAVLRLYPVNLGTS